MSQTVYLHDRQKPPAPNPRNTTLLSELVTITVTRRLHCTLRRHAVIGTRRSSWFHHSTPARYWHAIFGLLVSASALWFSGPYRWVDSQQRRKNTVISFSGFKLFVLRTILCTTPLEPSTHPFSQIICSLPRRSSPSSSTGTKEIDQFDPLCGSNHQKHKKMRDRPGK